jgi:hypothetical protein
VLELIAGGRHNRSGEPAGLLDLIADLEAGELPTWIPARIASH